MTRALIGLATTALLLGGTGCGGDGLDRVPITGLITAKGAPVAGASVQLVPATGTPGEGAIGTSSADGRFTVISSRESDAGVPPGKYTVRASRMMNRDGSPLPADATQAEFPDAIESIPAPYSTIASPLEVTIAASGGEVKIDIPAKLLGKAK